MHWLCVCVCVAALRSCSTWCRNVRWQITGFQRSCSSELVLMNTCPGSTWTSGLTAQRFSCSGFVSQISPTLQPLIITLLITSHVYFVPLCCAKVIGTSLTAATCAYLFKKQLLLSKDKMMLNVKNCKLDVLHHWKLMKITRGIN